MKSLQRNEQSGKILTELAVIGVLIGLFWLFTINELNRVKAFSESVMIERAIAVMDKALAIEFAAFMISGKYPPADYWQNLNPVSLLVKPSKNIVNPNKAGLVAKEPDEALVGYIGHLHSKHMKNMAPRTWAFLTDVKELVYRVESLGYFNSGIKDYEFIRYKVEYVSKVPAHLSKVGLQPIDQFSWSLE